MNKIILVTFALFAATLALDDSRNAHILRYENDNLGQEGFNYAFETSDGQSKQERGELKNVGTDDETLVVRGIINYVGDDGKQYSLSYIADENGFQPQADHLPKVNTLP